LVEDECDVVGGRWM